MLAEVIHAPIDAVWSRIRDFNGMPIWHPAIADSLIENNQPSDKVGCIRCFNFKSGGQVRERLLALNDRDHVCSYTILSAPLPVANYVGTLSLRRITDGERTYAEWVAYFDCVAKDEKDLIDKIGQGVFQAGFDALKEYFTA